MPNSSGRSRSIDKESEETFHGVTTPGGRAGEGDARVRPAQLVFMISVMVTPS